MVHQEQTAFDATGRRQMDDLLRRAAAIIAALAAMGMLLPAAATLAEEPWPQFLGPALNGSCGQAALPLTWSETKNVRWKTAIHDRGHSSPVVWENQIWLTTAGADGKQLFALQ